MHRPKIILSLLGLLLICVVVAIILSQVHLDFWVNEESHDSHELGIQPVYGEDGELYYWTFDEDMEERLNKLVLDPVRSKYGIEIDADMMSRCTSYVGYTLSTEEDGLTPVTTGGFYYGEAQVYQGCEGSEDDPIGFRIATDGGVAEMKFDGTYVSVEDWSKEQDSEDNDEEVLDLSMFDPIRDSHETVLAWKFGEDMEDKLNELILNAIHEKYGIALDPDLMSRCASKVDYRLDENEEDGNPVIKDGFYYGEVLVYQGCDAVDDKMLFRISLDGTEGGMQTEEGTYIPVEEWLKL